MRKSACCLEDITVEWLKSRKYEVKESTLANYRYFLDHYILPDLGRRPLQKLDANSLLAYAEGLESRGSGAATINKCLVILHMLLEYAAESGCKVAERRSVKTVRRKNRKISILTEEEQTRLNRYLFGKECPLRREIRMGIILSLYTGLRIGEVCALKWENLDLSRGMILVEKTMSRIYIGEEETGKKSGKPRRTRIEISSPKTENSRREIPLPGFLQEYLRNEQRERHQYPEYYVLTGTQRPMEPRNYSYHFYKVRRDLGLVKCNYHMLRHTFATKCVEAGFDMKTLSEILGHSNVSTTLNLYAHPTMQMKRNYMEKLEGAYGR